MGCQLGTQRKGDPYRHKTAPRQAPEATPVSDPPARAPRPLAPPRALRKYGQVISPGSLTLTAAYAKTHRRRVLPLQAHLASAASAAASINRVEGLLTRADWFQKLAHAFFFRVWKYKVWRYAFQLCIISALSFVTVQVVIIHETPSGPGNWLLFNVALPAAVVLLGLFVSALPVGILAYYERQAGVRDTRLKLLLSDLLAYAGERAGKTYSSEEAVDVLIEEIRDNRGISYFLSPNAIYLLADRSHEALEPVDGGELGLIVSRLASSAPRFRTALYEARGAIHWVLPDTGLDRVRYFLEERARNLGISGSVVRDFHQRAASWARDELRLERKKRGQRTWVHFTKCVPDYRLFFTTKRLFFQKFPTHAPGLTEPVRSLKQSEDPELFLALRVLLEVWCGNLNR